MGECPARDRRACPLYEQHVGARSRYRERSRVDYQHIPGETHDLDEVFERILVDNDGRQSVFSMGKAGILWELDRKTGHFLNAVDLGYQNVLNVDAQTGQVQYRPGMVPRLNTRIDYCPGPGGIENLFAMSYSPDTRGSMSL